ncbi:Mediator of RNA polymerase II transcription subunit 31 [Apiospora arundinis]
MAEDFWPAFDQGIFNQETEFGNTLAGNTDHNANDQPYNFLDDYLDIPNDYIFGVNFDPILNDGPLPDVASLPPLDAPMVPPLQFGDDVAGPTVVPSLDHTHAAQQPQLIETGLNHGATRRSKPKAPKAPTASEWNRQKPKIRELYLEKNYTCDQTRDAMKEEHNFEAASHLYKQKFHEWGWVKNLPQSWTPKMVRLAEERRPKDTVFQLGPKKWTMQEIKRKREKGIDDIEFDSPSLPSELILRTPTLTSPLLSQISLGGGRHLSQSPLLQIRATPRPWSPVFLPPLSQLPRRGSIHILPSISGQMAPPSMGPPERSNYPWLSFNANASRQTGLLSPPTHHAPFRIPGRSLDDLNQQRDHSKSLMREGQFGEAIEKLNEILMGYQHLLTPTHEQTMETAYLLVEALKQDDRADEADSVLNWLGKEIVQRYGIQSQQSVNHFTRVINLLRAWLRNKAADLLVWRLTEELAANKGSASNVPSIHGFDQGIRPIGTLDGSILEALFSPPRNANQVDTHLRLAELLIDGKPEAYHTLETALKNDIAFLQQENTTASGDSVIGNPVRQMKARHLLARLHLLSKKNDEADEIFKSVEDIVKSHTRHIQGSAIDMSFVREAAKFGFLRPYEGKGDELLELLACYLEDSEQAVGKKEVAIAFSIHVGLTLQHLDWSLADGWFQRALALSIRQNGLRSTTTVQLDEALDKQWYDVTTGGEFALMFGGVVEFRKSE